MKNITISEYGLIGCENVSNSNVKFVDYLSLTIAEFKELEKIWKSNGEVRKAFEFVGGSCFKATSYVGVIQTENLSIEILPKIYKEVKKELHRKIFIEMVKPLLKIKEIQIEKTNLSTTKNKNIFEIFITLFVQSIDQLIHKGIKSDYIAREDNQYFLKGKLKFNQHIKQNYIHKERFFVEFDEYLQDRVENRLIKSAINLLIKRTKDNGNKRALRQQLFIFDQVKLSKDYSSDFKKVKNHRGMKHYEFPMKLTEVFLKNESFTSLRGKNNVFAMLFSMEKIFEDYIEYELNRSKEELEIKEVKVNGLESDWLLENGNCTMVNQQPDYILEMKDGNSIVADAKWKLFDLKTNENEDCKKVGISSSDAYQIFSYLNYYNVKKSAYIFVPQTDDFDSEIILKYRKKYDNKLEKNREQIIIRPIDLEKLIDNNYKPIMCEKFI